MANLLLGLGIDVFAASPTPEVVAPTEWKILRDALLAWDTPREGPVTWPVWYDDSHRLAGRFSLWPWCATVHWSPDACTTRRWTAAEEQAQWETRKFGKPRRDVGLAGNYGGWPLDDYTRNANEGTVRDRIHYFINRAEEVLADFKALFEEKDVFACGSACRMDEDQRENRQCKCASLGPDACRKRAFELCYDEDRGSTE